MLFDEAEDPDGDTVGKKDKKPIDGGGRLKPRGLADGTCKPPLRILILAVLQFDDETRASIDVS